MLITLSKVLLTIATLCIVAIMYETMFRKVEKRRKKEQQENNNFREKCKATKKQNYEEWRAEQKTKGEENI